MIIGVLFIVFVYGSEHQSDQCLVFSDEYAEIINIKKRLTILEEKEKKIYESEKYFVIIIISTLFVVFCYLNKKIFF